jgi:hypothetical protein
VQVDRSVTDHAVDAGTPRPPRVVNSYDVLQSAGALLVCEDGASGKTPPLAHRLEHRGLVSRSIEPLPPDAVDHLGYFISDDRQAP